MITPNCKIFVCYYDINFELFVYYPTTVLNSQSFIQDYLMNENNSMKIEANGKIGILHVSKKKISFLFDDVIDFLKNDGWVIVNVIKDCLYYKKQE